MVRKIKWIFLTALFLLLVAVGYYTYAFLHFANNIQAKPDNTKLFSGITAQNTTKVSETYTPPKWEGKQRVNVLLLGGDSRGLKKNEIPRSDTLMVASIDPITKKAYLFSILRDTYVKIPGYGDDRINSALALGGPNLAMRTVGDLLGIPIQYYVYTDFKGFIALVDAIDGIDIEVEKDMKYSDSEDGHEYDINLKKGMQHLNGKTALQYVRFRHDALSDFARTERQRKFIQAVAEKMQSTSSLIKLPRILNSVDPYIETNLTTTDMLKLGSLGYEAKASGMVSEQIPPSELLIEKRVGGADVLSVNRDKLQSYIKALFEDRDPSLSPNQVPATKDNGKGGTNNSKTTNGSAVLSSTPKTGSMHN
ncbi:LCP family protein [Paenibacillus sp. NPDC056579]|uniref:LCP family protein n=1 Tax=Paenibacillus sp. NPDC056579 TaxID=3345871 RepID=UPI0036B7EF04